MSLSKPEHESHKSQYSLALHRLFISSRLNTWLGFPYSIRVLFAPGVVILSKSKGTTSLSA